MRSLIDLLSGLYRISEYLNGGEEENDLRVISWYALAHLLTIAIPVALLWKKLNLHQRMATLGCSIGLTLFRRFRLEHRPGHAVSLHLRRLLVADHDDDPGKAQG